MASPGPIRGMEFAQLRCFNHAQREAAARCLGCARFFCRECVSEHKNRLLCAQCIAEEAQRGQQARRNFLAPFRPALRLMLGLLLAWSAFYFMGKALIAVPSAFHDGLSAFSDDAGSAR